MKITIAGYAGPVVEPASPTYLCDSSYQRDVSWRPPSHERPGLRFADHRRASLRKKAHRAATAHPAAVCAGTAGWRLSAAWLSLTDTKDVTGRRRQLLGGGGK